MRIKHRRFCRQYITNGNNGTQAAITVGYTKDSANKTAYRLLKIPKVISYIKELQHKATERAEVTEDYILETLQRVIDMGLGDTDSAVVVKEGYGKGLTQTSSKKLPKADLAAVKGAAELLGRYKGMFTDKVDLKHSGAILRRIVNVNPTKVK